MRSNSFLLFMLVLARALLGSVSCYHASGLTKGFYNKSCPRVELMIRKMVWKHVANNSTLPAKLLRMHFHDCFVRGCDASVLLNSTANNTAEKDAIPNRSLAGFDVIDELKAAAENLCPGVVSCADIVALAARDAVSFQFQRPIWEVKTGRRDGSISRSAEALSQIPSPFFNFSTLVQSFASKGLNIKDLVVLSGGHTIGVGHCNLFSNRLYNFTGKGDADPSLDPTYASFLRTQCRNTSDAVTTVPMDPGSSLSFDNHYFVALKENKGMFHSDAALLTNGTSSAMVSMLLHSGNFFNEFKNSIMKMGTIGVLTWNAGEIRKKCSVVN